MSFAIKAIDTSAFLVASNIVAGSGISVSIAGNNTTVSVNQSALSLSSIGGTLPVSKGGTGLTSILGANLLLGSNDTGTGLEYKSFTVGAGLQLNYTSQAIDLELLTGDIAITAWVGTLPVNRGGTGQITSGAAFNALSPMTTLGDLIYGSTSGAGTRLAGSTSSSKVFLSQTGTGTVSAAPSWSSVSKTDVGLGNVENTALSTWTGNSNLVLKAPATTSANTVTAANSTTVPLSAKGAASQSANLFQALDSSSNVLSAIDSTGNLSLPSTITFTSTSVDSGFKHGDYGRRMDMGMLGAGIFGAYFTCFGRDNGDSNQKGCATFVIDNRANSTAEFSIYRYTGSWNKIWGILQNGQVSHSILDNTKSAYVITAASGQSVNIFEVRDNSNTLLSAISSNGRIQMATVSGTPTGTPANGTSVFDTSTNKLWIYNGAWKSVTLS